MEHFRCREDQYEVSVTQDPWPDPYFFEEEKDKFERIQITNFREARNNLTKVKIIFGTLNKITYRHRAKYEVKLISFNHRGFLARSNPDCLRIMLLVFSKSNYSPTWVVSSAYGLESHFSMFSTTEPSSQIGSSGGYRSIGKRKSSPKNWTKILILTQSIEIEVTACVSRLSLI